MPALQGDTVAGTATLNDVIAPERARVRIQPSHGWVSLQLGELWRNRELVYFLTWRDVKVRYKQTLLGAGWAILQPLMTMLVFSLFFGKLAKVPSDGVAYPVFALAGLVPWTFFSLSLTQSANSLVGSANLIKKVYFPRLAVPLATVLACVVDFLLAFGFLVLALFYFKASVNWHIVFLPLFFLMAITTSLGVGLWFCAFNVRFRDVRYAIPFITQFWMFATPVAYPSSLLKEPWRTVFAINPMVGVVEGFRWALLGTGSAPGPLIVVSALVAVALLISGTYYFRHMEKTFADIV